jgi:hypothetical protein
MKKITIEMSETQAKIVQDALELYARLGLGQMEYVADHVIDNNDLSMARSDSIRGLAMGMKEVLGHPANGSYGIGSEKVGANYKQAYNMWQAMTRSGRNYYPIPDGEAPVVVRDTVVQDS